jgi:hypothetical protein
MYVNAPYYNHSHSSLLRWSPAHEQMLSEIIQRSDVVVKYVFFVTWFSF